jgi:hypothetical protein
VKNKEKKKIKTLKMRDGKNFTTTYSLKMKLIQVGAGT